MSGDISINMVTKPLTQAHINIGEENKKKLKYLAIDKNTTVSKLVRYAIENQYFNTETVNTTQ